MALKFSSDFEMEKKKKSNSFYVYKRLMVYVFPYWRLFIISVIGFVIYASTQPLFAVITQYIIDTLNSEDREGMMYLPAFFVGLFFIRGLGSFLGNYFLGRISGNVVHNLRCEIFNHYTSLPALYFDIQNSGYMISRITHNVGEVTRATTDSARAFIREGFTAIGLMGYLIMANWQLSLVFMAITPIVAIMVNYISKRLKRLSHNLQETVGDMSHIVTEMVTGNRIVKSFGGEGYEKKRFKSSSLDNRRQHLKLIMTMSINSPVMQFIVSLALAGLMYLALLMMQDSGTGEFVAYMTAAFMLPKPIRQLSDANAEIQRGIAAAESLFQVLDEPAEIDEGSYVASSVKGQLVFRSVGFKYYQAEEWAVKNINLDILPGQSVALVGASGGGKSTLVNLIPRFYEYDVGEIMLDGVELKKYQLTNLRNQIALVTQHVVLFNDTVANNIAYGQMEGFDQDRIVQAARDANALEFIEKLPNGMETLIGENGFNLSGGQRQRLAIARALLKNAPVLILDEATSALDTKSERLVQEALNKIMKDRTTIIIAHRLSTIENADKIVVLDHGEIVEQGRHQELMRLGGKYSKLHLKHQDGFAEEKNK